MPLSLIMTYRMSLILARSISLDSIFNEKVKKLCIFLSHTIRSLQPYALAGQRAGPATHSFLPLLYLTSFHFSCIVYRYCYVFCCCLILSFIINLHHVFLMFLLKFLHPKYRENSLIKHTIGSYF
jgi:hypothetical protein